MNEIKDIFASTKVVIESTNLEHSPTCGFSHQITKQLSKKVLAKRYLKEKGIKDEVKTKLLIETLKKAESC